MFRDAIGKASIKIQSLFLVLRLVWRFLRLRYARHESEVASCPQNVFTSLAGCYKG